MSQTETPQDHPAVEVAALARSYGEREALRGVSFSVSPGEIFALLGPNGGGKTTLFRILSTALPPSGGEARIFGRSVVSEAGEVRRHLGVVFQRPALDARLTAMENLQHAGHLYGLHGRPLRERAAAALARLGVADRARDLVGALSGGLARRVELAKAILHAPRLLLLDEPSTGLDPAARLDFMSILADLRARDGATVVLTTHFLEEADRSDRVAILDAGRLVAVGAPGDLRSQIGGDVVTLETPDAPGLAARIAERFGVPAAVVNGAVRLEAPRGHEFLRDAVEAFGGQIRSASFGRPTLEDVFVHHTGRRLFADETEGDKEERR